MSQRAFAGKKDFIIVLCLLIASLGGWLWYRFTLSDTAVEARLMLEGEAVQTIDLSLEQTITISQRPGVVLEVRNGRCGFIHSDCPDQVCVNTGMLDTPGQYAACLPNGMVLQIVGSGDNEMDTVVYYSSRSKKPETALLRSSAQQTTVH